MADDETYSAERAARRARLGPEALAAIDAAVELAPPLRDSQIVALRALRSDTDQVSRDEAS